MYIYIITNITLQQKNSTSATNLELGWVIDSGASAHMIPFRSDCRDINHTYKQIYLADEGCFLSAPSYQKEIIGLILKEIK